MSGWIKWEKDLESDPRVLRMARELKRICNAEAFHPVTLVCGGLIRMWSYADAHIREDDTLDLGGSQLDEVIGITGFCSLLPEDWLRVIDENTVELPGFQSHNGVEAKKKALTQKRVTQHRNKVKRKSVTQALPDQDQDQDQDHRKNPPAPKGANAEFHDQILSAYHELLPELPSVRDWSARRRRKLDARIAERVKAGKPADKPEYWRALFTQVQASDFLCGRKSDWRCPGLEWLLEPKNFTKVIEGAYRNNEGMNGHAR